MIIAQRTPIFLGWRKRSGADSEDFEHYHAPCLQYIAHGKECRIVTVLYPSNNGQVAIEKLEASSDINSTDVTLTILGNAVKIDENDYKTEDTNEALLS